MTKERVAFTPAILVVLAPLDYGREGVAPWRVILVMSAEEFQQPQVYRDDNVLPASLQFLPLENTIYHTTCAPTITIPWPPRCYAHC